MPLRLLMNACLAVPVLGFAEFDKPFLLETGANKLGLEAELLQKQTESRYHPVTYASQSLFIGITIIPQNKSSWH